MIANMDENGVITLQAETSIEAYALRKWCEQAVIQRDDIMRAEKFYWRGSKVQILGGIATKETP